MLRLMGDIVHEMELNNVRSLVLVLVRVAAVRMNEPDSVEEMEALPDFNGPVTVLDMVVRVTVVSIERVMVIVAIKL